MDRLRYQGPPAGLMKMEVGRSGPPELLWPIEVSISDFEANWSPRGDWIAFRAKAGAMLISPDGKTRRLLRKPAFGAMAWSRDGATLYGRNDHSPQKVVAVDIATGSERVVAVIPPNMTLGDVWYPAQEICLSPDGKTLADTSIRHSGDIWMIEIADRPINRIAELLPSTMGSSKVVE
jgi:hypothetical protein